MNKVNLSVYNPTTTNEKSANVHLPIADVGLSVFVQIRLLREIWITAQHDDERRWVLRQLHEQLEYLSHSLESSVKSSA